MCRYTKRVIPVRWVPVAAAVLALLTGCEGEVPQPGPKSSGLSSGQAPSEVQGHTNPEQSGGVSPASQVLASEISLEGQAIQFGQLAGQVAAATGESGGIFTIHTSEGSPVQVRLQFTVGRAQTPAQVASQSVLLQYTDSEANAQLPNRFETGKATYVPKQLTLFFTSASPTQVQILLTGTVHVFDKATGQRAERPESISGVLQVAFNQPGTAE